MKTIVSNQFVDLKLLARWLRILGDPTRLRVCQLILEGTQCNSDIGEALSAAPNLVSYHLRVLQEAGLIESDKEAMDARRVYYRPKREAFATLNTMFSTFFAPRRTLLSREASEGDKS